MLMDTSPVHRIWHAKARYARFLTLPTARVIHILPAQHTGLSLASWTRPSFASSKGGGELHQAGNQQETKNLYIVHYTKMVRVQYVYFSIHKWIRVFTKKIFYIVYFTLCSTTTWSNDNNFFSKGGAVCYEYVQKEKPYCRNGQIKKFLTYEKIKRLLWNITVNSGLQITNALGQKQMRKMKNEKKQLSTWTDKK